MHFTPLPATLEVILLYLTFLAESLSYTSIINYLSGIWTLHKYLNYDHIDKKDFMIQITLAGIKRVIGHKTKQAVPITIAHLRLIYSALNLELSEDIAFWLALLFGFRALLRKSNLFDDTMCLKERDVTVYDWGVQLTLDKTKTIQFRERQLQIPLVNFDESSIFSATSFIRAHRKLRGEVTPDRQFLTFKSSNGTQRGSSYSWFSAKLHAMSVRLALPSLTSHSLRRGGATALAETGTPLHEIRRRGDWRSFQVLLYLDPSEEAKRDSDLRACARMFPDRK